MASLNRPPNLPTEGVHDRHMDFPVPTGSSASIRRPALHKYQRLVANPFLAVIGAIGWIAFLRFSLDERNLRNFFLAFAGVWLILFLFQYHCLDCGRTANLWGWKKHCCERVEARRLAGGPRRFR